MKTVTLRKQYGLPQIKWLKDNMGEPNPSRWFWEEHFSWVRITFNNEDDYTLFMLTHGGE